MLAGHTIWLWHYLHADWQWEQSRAWHEDRYALAVHEVLDLMQQNPEITYYFDTASEFLEPVIRKLGPRVEELRARVREGRIRIVSAQVANARPNQVGDETYLRNLIIGRACFEATLPPSDLSLFHSVDIAIGHTQMPQILSLAGFTYYRAWRPHGPMNALGLPQQFVWEGLDGSRILVTRGCYGGLYRNEHVPFDYAEDWDGAVTRVFDHMFHDQILLGRSPSRQLWMTQGADDVRPLRTWEGDRPIDLFGFVAEWRRREDVPIRWCTPLEFSQAVAAHSEQLPLVSGVLDGCDCSYNAANAGANGLWWWRQMNDRRLLRAEWWSAAAMSIGFAAPSGTLRELWHQHLVYQAHAEEFSFREDLDHLISLARDVQFQAERIEHSALQAITRAAGGGDRLTQYVFNPHPWPVEADIELYHPCAAAGVQALEVVDEQDTPLAQQTLSELRHPRFVGTINDQWRLVRVALPPLGYRRLRVNELAEAAMDPPSLSGDTTIETSDLRLVYRDHALREIHDRRTGTIYQDADGTPWPCLIFHALDAQNWVFGGPEIARHPFIPEQSQWIHAGPLRWHHRSAGQLGPYQAQVDTVVADRGREIQMCVRLEGHWQRAPQTGFVTLLSTVGTGGAMTVDVPFGVEARDPDHDIYVDNLPTDRDLGITAMFERLRPGFFWGRSWADWSGDDHGVTLISADGCYYWFKDRERFGHVVVRCLDLAPGTWETRIAAAMSGTGTHTFNYALRLHDGDWRAAEPQRRAAELRHPLRVVRPDYPVASTLGDQHSFLALEGPALLSAYYTEAQHTTARLYEAQGQGGQATLTLDWAPSAAVAVDLHGEEIEVPVEMTDRQISVTLQPWQIVSLRLAHPASAE